jgi:hypothetical protein
VSELQLTETVRPRDLTMAVASRRVAEHKDLFEPVRRGGEVARGGVEAVRADAGD